MDENIVKLPPTCAKVEEIEAALIESYDKDSSRVIFDMEDVEFITAPSLIYLVAITQQLLIENKDRVVKYHLPKAKKIRDVLRIWEFPKAMKDVTGRNFASLVRIEDIEYFGEKHNPDEIIYWLARKDKGLAQLMKEKFFSLTSLPFDKIFQKESSVDNEVSKWENSVILSILKNHLDKFDGSNADLLPSSIIWETITNALRHGEANKLITGSYFVNRSNFFTLCYWDNGLNIYETLLKTLNKEGTIRIATKKNVDKKGIEYPNFTALAKFEDVNGNVSHKYYHSDDTPINNSKNPNDNWGEKDILVASLFPGITSDINVKTFIPIKNGKGQFVGEPGSGLTSLMNVVIDIFNGEIAIRVGKYFMNIKKPTRTEYKNYEKNESIAKYKKLYRIKVKEIDSSIPEFRGNMITIRLPLKSTQ